MISTQQKYDKLIVSYYNENGGISLDSYRIPPSQMFEWKRGGGGGQLSFDGFPVSRTRTKRLSKYRINEFLNDLPQAEKDKIFSLNMPKMWFCDIETEVLDGFPDVRNPQEKCLALAVCNENGDIYGLGFDILSRVDQAAIEHRINEHLAPIPDELKPKPKKSDFTGKLVHWKFVYIKFSNEYEMLNRFMTKMVPSMPMLTGWNFLKFDWAFLMNRSSRIGIDITKTSPTGALDSIMIKDKFRPEESLKIPIPKHRGIIDYMSLWYKWDRVVKHKSSESLDFVSGELFGLKKLTYTGTLMELYHNDFITYLAYCAIDTILVSLIHAKLRTSDTMLTLASTGHVGLKESSWASTIVESMLGEYYKKQNRYMVRNPHVVASGSYSGGFVMEPRKGKDKDIMVKDYESMYPFTIIAFRISIENYVGNIMFNKSEGGTETAESGVHTLKYNGDVINNSTKIPVGKWHLGNKFMSKDLEELSITKDHVVTANGCVYYKPTDAAMADMAWDLYATRKENKSHMKAIRKEIDAIKELIKNIKYS